ncbi:MAG TPA: cytochrome c oxidase subunit II [Candidatus Limnocylindria bacterium]|nr:cytochrome c oxidase subunit II [Candidatus Limnocylindria bacterium]
MSARRPHLTARRVLAAAIALVPMLLLLVGCQDQFPQSSLHPRSDVGWGVQRLLESITLWVVVIFVLVEGALIVAVIRFRNRPGLPEPKPVHGHTGLEIGWTIAPAIVLGFIAVPTVLTIFKTQDKAPPGALEVKVVGHQWWWEFQYPEFKIVTANELHVPVGRPVALSLETADVIHSFWFPAMGGKRDLVPAHTNYMWFTPEQTGAFPGQCAELCGTSHANMRMKLIVSAPEEFQAWVAAQQAPPVEPDSGSLAAQGKDVFLEVGCIACHTIEGVAPGVIGPNLNHIGSRTTIASAMFDNTPEQLGKWLEDPPARKPGALMPKLGLAPNQLAALVAYLHSLK